MTAVSGVSRLTWSLDEFGESHASLLDGFYQLVIDADFVASVDGAALDGNRNGTGGDNFVFTFHRLEGDATGDAADDTLDMQVVNSALGALPTSGTWNANADLDRDARVTVRDRVLVAHNAGRQVIPPVGAAAALTILPGDFNGNAAVGGDDLAAWRQQFGQLDASPFEGDADGDQDVDGADFLAWQRTLGASVNLAAASNVALQLAATIFSASRLNFGCCRFAGNGILRDCRTVAPLGTRKTRDPSDARTRCILYCPIAKPTIHQDGIRAPQIAQQSADLAHRRRDDDK